MSDRNAKLVYSTDRDVSGKDKGRINMPQSDIKPEDQKIIVMLERKGRRGKSVTVVQGLLMNQKRKAFFLKELKAKIGTGGTIKKDCFEFQGDHCDRLLAELKKKGFKPRRSGG